MIQAKRGTLKGLQKNPKGESSYDSLLERNYMLELEHMGGVTSWTKDHGIRIPYMIFGILPHHYEPDFLVTYADGSKEVHETKGAGFLFWVSTHAKRHAGNAWCRQHRMIYRFIENSRGALFVRNQGLSATEARAFKKSGRFASLDDL